MPGGLTKHLPSAEAVERDPAANSALGAQSLADGPFRSLFDANPLPMWLCCARTHSILAVNERALHYFGHRREQFLAMPVFEEPRSEAGGGFRHYRKRDGTSIAMRLETSAVEIDGRPAVLVVAIDATRERWALAENARYRDLLDVAAEWEWEWDETLRVSHLSPEFAESTGLLPQPFLERRLEESAITAGAANAWDAHRAAIEAHRRFRDFVFRVAGADGHAVWLKIGGVPVFDADGAFRGYRGVGSNVTAEIEANLALQERDRRFQQLFETASDWFWTTSAGMRVSYISPNFEALYGIPIAELLGRRFTDHPSARIDADMEAKVTLAVKTRQPLHDILYAHELAGGRVVWIKTNAMPIFDPEGVYCGYWGLSKDVTAEIDADRVLRESEEQFRQVLEASADCYWEQDAQYRNVFLSQGFERMGIPIAESLGLRHSEIPGVSFEPEMGLMVLRAQKQKQPYRDFIYCHQLPGSAKRWFKTSAAPLFDRNGVFKGYRGVGSEITQLIGAEAAARLAQERLKEAVAHVSQPIVVYDGLDCAVGFNQAFTDLHQAPGTDTPVRQGVTFRELAEWQLRFGFYADGPDETAVDLEMLLSGHLSGAEQTYRLRDGRWMQVVYRPLPGDSKVGLWTDVTELKRAEAERRTFERQLHHSQRLEALGTLAGGVAHEINNALVPVIALTKIVARKLPEDSLERRNLGTVLAGAERSRDLLKQILAFSRKEVEEHQYESVDVGAVLCQALQLMRATLPASIRVADELAPVPAIIGDAGQLQQIIVNLMTNAAHAIGQAQGVITVGLQLDGAGTHLRLSIADTGCGMDEATLSHVFEPFFTTKGVGEGTGLGLSIVHGIVRDHGGRIEVTSAPGQGTRFDIILPVPVAEADRSARLSQSGAA